MTFLQALKATLIDLGVLSWLIYAAALAGGLVVIRWIWTPSCPKCGGKTFRYIGNPITMRVCKKCGHVD
jgi:hypothetical protein